MKICSQCDYITGHFLHQISIQDRLGLKTVHHLVDVMMMPTVSLITFMINIYIVTCRLLGNPRLLTLTPDGRMSVKTRKAKEMIQNFSKLCLHSELNHIIFLKISHDALLKYEIRIIQIPRSHYHAMCIVCGAKCVNC